MRLLFFHDVISDSVSAARDEKKAKREKSLPSEALSRHPNLLPFPRALKTVLSTKYN
jgi:hypothetical protein